MDGDALKFSPSALAPADREGWMTKQGGSFKSWKRRWFVLKGDKLYYFKGLKDSVATGIIELSKDSDVRKEKKKGVDHAFSITTARRVFFMYPDQAKDTEPWMKAVQTQIEVLKGTGAGAKKPSFCEPTTTSTREIAPEPKQTHNNPEPKSEPTKAAPSAAPSGSVRTSLDKAKDMVPFLLDSAQNPDNDNKVYEFWQIWSESIPPAEELAEGTITFEVATSADMEKLTWRTSGPQNIFIQRMVDFFWNVGAPETEIDLLNDVGSLINPLSIGSWIDMSAKGGMDGGWFFPVEVPLKFALEASDPGEAVDALAEWAEAHNITRCLSVGRDMGAAPPRQTEIRLQLSGDTFDAQLQAAISAYEALGVPVIPEDALAIIRQHATPGLALSIITSSEGMVRLGLLFPDPPKPLVSSLCSLSGASSTTQLWNFEAALGVACPAWVEFQYLMKGFGYGVYKEGFDVVFHYLAGVEDVQS